MQRCNKMAIMVQNTRERGERGRSPLKKVKKENKLKQFYDICSVYFPKFQLATSEELRDSSLCSE